MENNYQLYLGDCLEVMKDIPDGSVDMVLCDPPYKMTKRGKSCRPNWMPDAMGDNVFDGNLPNTKIWMSELFRVLKEETHIYVFTNTISLQEFLNCATEAGFKLHNILTMIKDTGMPNRWYYKQTELILFMRKGKAKPINDFTSRDNFHAIMPKERDGNKFHVTQKPLDITQMLVTNSSKENEVVLDLFMGSGTTGVACMNTNRKFIGIEKEEKYFEIAKKRIEDAAQDPMNIFFKKED